MTSRERIRRSVAHLEPDKVPAHINATKWVVTKLKKALNVKTDNEVLEALHVEMAG